MSVKQSIKVTNAGLSPILSVAQGTGAIEYEFTVSDFDIPSGSAAVAYNIQPTGNIVSQTCSISGNTITVKPPAYYFLRGKNYMQFQVSKSNEDLFSFLIEVWCAQNISQPEVIVAENPSLVSQLISDVGLLSSQLDNLLSIPSGSLSTSADAALADIKVGWDGTTYDTPGDAVRGQIGSLSEDIDNDFFAFGKIPVKLESIGNVYFGYTHGDRNANAFEKVRFRTVVGKLYMIEATIQTNIPLFKCGAYYYPVSPISDVVGRVKARGYFFGDGNVMSINTVSTEEKNVYECEVHGISNITKIVDESKSAIESINHRFMWNTFKNLISKCICCGDSLTRGYYSASIPNENGTLPTYPKELAKITGWECTNAGRSGYDSIQWYSERFKLFDFSDKDVAVLFLGTNRGISSDYNDVLDGSTTGSAYRKIIEGIHEQNPQCKVYALSCFSTSSTQNTLEEVNNNIQHISSLYDYVYFCDFQNNPYFDVLSDNVHSSETGIHFTPIGYKLMANAIYMLMVDSFIDNISDYDTPIS